MPDVVDDLFNPAVPLRALTLDRSTALNGATARKRLFSRLRSAPLAMERVPALASVIRQIGVSRCHAELASVCADPALSAVHRAAPAYLLLVENLDPRVPPAGLELLAEAALIGAALIGDVAHVGPLLVALLGAGKADADALITRLEPWRLPVMAPGSLVYGGVLNSRACARSHAAVLDVLEGDPEAERVVRRAVRAGALDVDLAEAWLERPPAKPLPAVGRAWVGPPRDDCDRRDVQLILEVPGGTTQIAAHLGDVYIRDVTVLHGVGPETAAHLSAAYDAITAYRAADPAAVVATARSARPHVPGSELQGRVLWLLRRLQAGERTLAAEDLQAFLAQAPNPDDLVRAIAGAPGGDPAVEPLTGPALDAPLDAAVDALAESLQAGVLSEGGPDVARGGYLTLLGRVLEVLEAVPFQWGVRPPRPTIDAWLRLAGGLDVGAAKGGLHAEASALIPVDRRDQLAWRELLAMLSYNLALPKHTLDVWEVIADHRGSFERLGATPRDVAQALGAPPDLATTVATLIEIDVDAPLASTRVHEDEG